jgi:hypothetical protein
MTECSTVKDMTTLAHDLWVYARDNKKYFSTERLGVITTTVGYILDMATSMNDSDAVSITTLRKMCSELEPCKE